jgi:hypothetical protein
MPVGNVAEQCSCGMALLIFLLMVPCVLPYADVDAANFSVNKLEHPSDLKDSSLFSLLSSTHHGAAGGERLNHLILTKYRKLRQTAQQVDHTFLLNCHKAKCKNNQVCACFCIL